jgi:hypothetical protein
MEWELHDLKFGNKIGKQTLRSPKCFIKCLLILANFQSLAGIQLPNLVLVGIPYTDSVDSEAFHYSYY